MSNPSVFAPLAHQPFRMLFLGQLFSDLGNWLDVMTLVALIVYDWKLGASSVAIYTITYGLPWVVIGPLASVWVDRWPRKGGTDQGSFQHIDVRTTGCFAVVFRWWTEV